MYTTVKISGIITQIATTEIKGYTIGVLEVFLPEKEMKEKEEKQWIKSNNKRMEAICKFLNENNL